MPIKIKYQLAALKGAFPDIKAAFNSSLEDGLGALITKEIMQGKSPVEGQGRFDDYADSYKDRITESEGIVKGTDGKLNSEKKLRPVNLHVSGKMLESQQVKRDGGRINVTYLSKFAAIHNEGGSKLPRRAMLPNNPGEKFSRTITKYLLEEAKKAIRYVIK